MGKSATLTIRLEQSVMNAARQRADLLGISLSTVIENYLRRFIGGNLVGADADIASIPEDASLIPTPQLMADIAQSEADYAAGDYDIVTRDTIDAYFEKVAAMHPVTA